MSNELSVSETTPLRRPESGNSETSITTPIRNIGANNYNTTVNGGSGTNNVLQHTNPFDSATNNHIYLNNQFASYNNNNHLPSSTATTIATTTTATSTTISSSSIIVNMDTNKRILCRVGLDVLILLCVGFPILCFFLWGDSYKRGFFCDDESLKHPFHESTIRNWMLYIIGLVLPIGIIIAVEVIRSNQLAKRSNGNSSTRRYVFMDYEIPEWMIECYKKIGIFGFGAAVSQLTTDIAKYSIGRLRPHFFTVCQPIMPDGSTCDDPINAGRYIENFNCRGLGSTARMLKEVRLSFPSGHSSFTFYTMVYVALYLQSRMTWRGSKLLRHTLQFMLIMIAWYTALSRVSDYKHHWSDVLTGSAIGALCAVIVANYVSDLFRDKTITKSYTLPRVAQDIPPQTVTTNGH